MRSFPTPAITHRKRQTENRQSSIFLILALLAIGGCGPAAANPILVFCSPDSPRMQQAIAALRENLPAAPLEVVCVPEFGDELKASLRRIQQLKPRLLVVLGTPALMAVAPVEKHLPVVFALVADPYFTGAAYGPERPEEHQENLTGIASPAPLEAALKQGAGLLGQASWGLLYDPNDGLAAELAAEFTQKAPQFGITPLTEASTGAATDPQALKRLLGRGARTIYLPPAASAGRYASLVLDRGRRLQVMVVSGYPEGSHQGALLWVALDYRRLGEEAAALAQRVLNGEAPKKIPIATATPLKVEVDEKLLRHWSGYPGKN
ncbi:MAG: ABC transporter substrate-binding protein [Desulfobaccales bacterium]